MTNSPLPQDIEDYAALLMVLTPEQQLEICHRKLREIQQWMGLEAWQDYRAWLKTEDPQLYRLSELTSHRETLP